MLALAVADGHLANAGAVPGGQGGNKAVQLAVERDLLYYVAAVPFERGAEVVDTDPAQLGHQPVGAARGDAAQPQVVQPALAPAADDVVSVGQLLQELGDVVGVVLQVPVHGDDELTLGMVETGGQGGSLAEIAAQLHHYHPAVHGGDLFQQAEGGVAAAIVHEYQLKALAGGFHHSFQTVVKDGDVFLFVVERNHDGIFDHGEVYRLYPAAAHNRGTFSADPPELARARVVHLGEPGTPSPPV